MTETLSRRHFAAGAGATLAVASIGARPALAQQQRMVLGTYGGDTQRFIEELILKPVLEPKGIMTAVEAASDAPRRLKLQAEKRLPRGTYDVVHCQASILYQLHEEGLIDKLDAARIPEFANIMPVVRTDYAVPHTVTSRVILYNPNRISPAPTGFADLWNPKYAGKVGLINPHYNMAISSAALSAGGGMTDYEPGKPKLMELKKSGVNVYPSNEAFGQALQTEECWIGIMLQSRGIMWKKQGIPVEIAYPKEGVALDWWGFGIPKNARNKDAAYEFINASLTKPAQTGWATNMWSPPATTTGMAALDGSLKSLMELPASLQDKVIGVDPAYLTKNDVANKEWWDRVFKA